MSDNVFLVSAPEPSVVSWCFTCTAPEASLQCTRCHMRKYCSKACQSKHWKEHKTECEGVLITAAQQVLIEPSVELLKEEPPAKITMRYAAARHNLALNKKLVFIFYNTDSAFAHYLFARTEILRPEVVDWRLLVVTLAEFRTYYIFSLHRNVRRIVEAIHACKVKESAWVSLTCMNAELFEVTVRGGLYAPEAKMENLPAAQAPAAPAAVLASETANEQTKQ